MASQNFNQANSGRWDLVFFGFASVVIALLIAWPMMDVSLGGDQYVYLARNLAHGSLNVDAMSARYGDYALWNGHKYLPFGVVPALLLVPLLPLLNAGMALVGACYLFTIFNVILFLGVLARAGVGGQRRRWITLLYFGGTPYLSIAIVGISSYFAQIVMTTFLLLAISEALGKRRWLLAGLCVGAAAGARMTALFAVPFFVLLAVKGNDKTKTRSLRAPSVNAAYLFVGLFVPLLLIAVYNWARFGSFTETGFGKAILYTNGLGEARAVGLFSVRHIPKNLFMMLLQGPLPAGGEDNPVLHFPYIQPSPWGMGVFFASPALLYAFRAGFRDRLIRACWLAVGCIMLPLITYYGIGYVQFGYRYALDFMPFLILLAARGLPEPITNRARALIVASVMINMWGAVTLAIRI